MGHPWRELLTKETQVNKLGEGSGRYVFQEADFGVEGGEENIPMNEIRYLREIMEDMDEDYHGVMEVRIHKILEIYL